MKGLMALFAIIGLVGCTASEQAMLSPEASYSNQKKSYCYSSRARYYGGWFLPR